MRFPSASSVAVTLPAQTDTGGTPKTAASAGVRMSAVGPVSARVMVIPSGLTVSFVGSGEFTEMLFPLSGFVQVPFKEPLNRKIMDPSGAVNPFPNALTTSNLSTIGNPQKSAGRVKVWVSSPWNSHPSPRPPARAGVAVASPPSMPSSAPSATITPNRLMAIHPLRATALWPGAGHIVQPQDGPRCRWPTPPAVPLVGGSVNKALPFLVTISAAL